VEVLFGAVTSRLVAITRIGNYFGDINFVGAYLSELCPTHLVHNLMLLCADFMFGAPIDDFVSHVFIMPQKWCFNAQLRMLI
jgi:hypothetical protein